MRKRTFDKIAFNFVDALDKAFPSDLLFSTMNYLYHINTGDNYPIFTRKRYDETRRGI